MTPTPAEKNVLTVLESCFKIAPGTEAALLELQRQFWPVATSQPGFISVEVGTIVNSSWLYFGVRFESKNQMDAWHRHPRHHRRRRGVLSRSDDARYPQGARRQPRSPRNLLDEIQDEVGNIVPPLGERRNSNRHDRQAMEEILTETPLGYLALEVARRR